MSKKPICRITEISIKSESVRAPLPRCFKKWRLVLSIPVLMMALTLKPTEAFAGSERNTAGYDGAHSETVIWTGGGDGFSWADGRNWSTGIHPGPADNARFTTPPEAEIIIDTIYTLGRLECEFPSPSDQMTVNGAGKLVLAGVDSGIIGKPTSLRAIEGILEIGPDLEIEILVTRVYAYDGGTLVISSPRVYAGEYDLKLGISQTGTIRVNTAYWEPGIHLDVATSRTWGLGPHFMEFALSPEVPQGITFPSFKEHDADPFHITGFEQGDYLRFREDPRLSMDPEKELILEKVRFVGWPNEGRAEIKQKGEFWYLLPSGTPIPDTDVHNKERRSIASSLPDRTFPEAQINVHSRKTVVPASTQHPVNPGADLARLSDGRMLLVYSEQSDFERAKDRAMARLMGVVSDDAGKTWSKPFALIDSPDGCIEISMPSLIRAGNGRLLLFANCRVSRSEGWVVTAECETESLVEIGTAAWSPATRIKEGEENVIACNDRAVKTQAGQLILPLATSYSYGEKDSSPSDIRSWCLLSDDNGGTWRTSSSRWKGPGRGLLAPTVVELRDGSLLMLNQTNTHRQYRSQSRDGGETWSAPTEVTRLISPDAPAIIRRDPQTGWLAVIWNHNSNRIKTLHSRQSLTVCFSNDDGKSWFGNHTFEHDPTNEKTWSNPSLTFDDGRAHVTYYERTESADNSGIYSIKLLTLTIDAG